MHNSSWNGVTPDKVLTAANISCVETLLTPPRQGIMAVHGPDMVRGSYIQTFMIVPRELRALLVGGTVAPSRLYPVSSYIGR